MNEYQKKVAAELVFREMMQDKVFKVVNDINRLMSPQEKMEFDLKCLLSSKRN